MRNRRDWSLLVLALGLFSPLARASAPADLEPWGLVLDVQTQRTPLAGAPAPASDSLPESGRLTAAFDARHLAYAFAPAHRLTLIDFPNGRRYRIDLQRKQYVEAPLIVELARREVTYRQRISQGALLLDDDPNKPPPFELSEHELSVADEAGDARIDREERDGTVTYTWERRPLLTHGTDLVTASPAEVAQYLGLIRELRGGHPQILARLHALKGLPRTLTLTQPGTRQSLTTTFRFEERRAPDPTWLTTDGLARSEPAAGDWIGSLARQVEALPRAQIDQEAATLATRAMTARSAGRSLETMLALLEYNLMVGPGDPDAQPPIDRQALTADPDVKAFVGALQPGSEVSARANAATLAGLRARVADPAGQAVLAIFEANNLGVIGERDAAEALYRQALTARPLLPGAWRELGDLCWHHQDVSRAWSCYEIAERIGPRHPAVEEPRRIERQLRTAYPEYFQAVPPAPEVTPP